MLLALSDNLLLMLLTTDRSPCKFVYVLFSFHSKIYRWRDVWMRCMIVRMRYVLFAESLGFSPRWVSLSLSLLTFCTVYLCTKWGPRGGECPWVTLLQLPNNTKRLFSGAFHYSIQTILLYLSLSTLYISSRLSDYPCTTKPKCHRTVDYKDLNSDLKAC